MEKTSLMDSKLIITDEEINYLSRQLIAKYRENLYIEGVNATGNLAVDSSESIRVHGDNVIIEWSLKDYWKYVEYGRKPGGRFPPPQAIENWIKVKPIVPRPNRQGKVPTTKQLAYLISRKIVKEGIEPKNVLYNTLRIEEDTIIKRIAERVAELYSTEVTAVIDKELF